ncbi:undecaprenyl-phosphate glucose phosphotransferase [Dongia sp.]|uniref:undecaprenyl-phosphate glucose phosphotransferase n=1 Tax=Dongia sp. TaxID=1977262 RepID=UPI0035AF3B2B
MAPVIFNDRLQIVMKNTKKRAPVTASLGKGSAVQGRMTGVAMLQLHIAPNLRSNQAIAAPANDVRGNGFSSVRLIPRDPKLGGVLLAICDISVFFATMVAITGALLSVGTDILQTNLPHFFVTSALSFFLAHAFAQSYKAESLSRISKISRTEFILKPAMLTGVAAAIAFGLETLLGRSIPLNETRLLLGQIPLEVHFALFAALAVALERGAAYALLSRLQAAGYLATNIVLFGADAIGQRLMRVVRDDYADSVQVRGIFDDRLQRVPLDLHGIPVRGGIDQLVDLVQNTPTIDKVLVALPMGAEDRILHLLARLRHLPVDVALVPEFIGVRVDKQVIRDAHPPFLNLSRRPQSGLDRVVKRSFDMVAAAAALIVLSPLLLTSALAIKVSSPGPVFFRQPRMGFNNRKFNVLKFRSMYSDCADLEARQQTRRDDARITRVGALLRKTSIDELPQLINVLKGDMSLVGPRPHALGMQVGNRLCDEIVREYAVRHRMKPGITGWAQVHGLRGAVDVPEVLEARVHHDIFYIDNWSFIFDLRILLMTVIELVRPRNAF